MDSLTPKPEDSQDPSSIKPIFPLEPEDPMPPAKPLFPKKTKPSLEGINMPLASEPAKNVLNPNLTEAEKKLIKDTDEKTPFKIPVSETKITLPAKKPNYLGAVILFALICFLLFGGYQLFLAYFHKTKSEAPSANQLTDQNPVFANNQTVSSTPSTMTTSSSTPAMATSTPLIAPPAAPLTQLKVTATPTNYLNVRSGPSLGYQIITQVHPGEIYPYSATKNGWYQITLTDGSTGWVIGRYITKQP